MSLFGTLGFLMRHPLSKRDRAGAIVRYLRWQVGSRLLGYPVVVPFVGTTCLVASSGMTGATGNIYAGLHEFREMAFLLHLLRPEDSFMDVGANIGSYTVLAAGGVGAQVIAVEPIPETFDHLRRNVNVNNLADRVSLFNVGVSESQGVLEFYTSRDTANAVVAAPNSAEPVVRVPITTLDQLAASSPAVLAVKLDTEGYELPILKGGPGLLLRSQLKAMVVEINGSGNRYGHRDAEVVSLLEQTGFECVDYDPAARMLKRCAAPTSGNGIFVRDLPFVAERLSSARQYMTTYGLV